MYAFGICNTFEDFNVHNDLKMLDIPEVFDDLKVLNCLEALNCLKMHNSHKVVMFKTALRCFF